MERTDARTLSPAVLNERRRRAVQLRLAGMKLDEVAALAEDGVPARKTGPDLGSDESRHRALDGAGKSHQCRIVDRIPVAPGQGCRAQGVSDPGQSEEKGDRQRTAQACEVARSGTQILSA